MKDQGDDPGALVLRDAGLTTRAGAVSEPGYPFGVEAVEALSYGLRMTTEFLGYLGGAQTLPAQRDDAGAEDPVSGSVATSGEFAYLSLFLYVLRCAGAQWFRHDRVPSRSAVQPRAYVYRFLGTKH